MLFSGFGARLGWVCVFIVYRGSLEVGRFTVTFSLYFSTLVRAGIRSSRAFRGARQIGGVKYLFAPRSCV